MPIVPLGPPASMLGFLRDQRQARRREEHSEVPANRGPLYGDGGTPLARHHHRRHDQRHQESGPRSGTNIAQTIISRVSVGRKPLPDTSETRGTWATGKYPWIRVLQHRKILQGFLTQSSGKSHASRARIGRGHAGRHVSWLWRWTDGDWTSRTPKQGTVALGVTLFLLSFCSYPVVQIGGDGGNPTPAGVEARFLFLTSRPQSRVHAAKDLGKTGRGASRGFRRSAGRLKSRHTAWRA